MAKTVARTVYGARMEHEWAVAWCRAAPPERGSLDGAAVCRYICKAATVQPECTFVELGAGQGLPCRWRRRGQRHDRGVRTGEPRPKRSVSVRCASELAAWPAVHANRLHRFDSRILTQGWLDRVESDENRGVSAHAVSAKWRWIRRLDHNWAPSSPESKSWAMDPGSSPQTGCFGARPVSRQCAQAGGR